jgi:hypothetical protein
MSQWFYNLICFRGRALPAPVAELGRPNMRILLASLLALVLWCSCAKTHLEAPSAASLNRRDLGWERVLTNAHVAIWIPADAHVREGRVTSVDIYETTPPRAFVRDYTISSEITVRTEKEFREHTRFFKEYDIEQEHPSLTLFDVPLGKCLRKDIRDAERGRIISARFNVRKTNSFRQCETGTFQEDIRTAKRIVESIVLLKAQPDEADIFNPLTVAKVEHVKREIENLQPYMTPKDCVVALGLPLGELKGSDSGPGESRSISMRLREGSVLVLGCDRRGYVISAQLNDKKWEWKKDEKSP